MEPDEELVKVFRAWWSNESVHDSPDYDRHAHEELVSLLEHLHSHGWAHCEAFRGGCGLWGVLKALRASWWLSDGGNVHFRAFWLESDRFSAKSEGPSPSGTQ